LRAEIKKERKEREDKDEVDDFFNNTWKLHNLCL
jgi:hypothetical protein